ncbi:MAG: hypothetical protein R3B70_42960 [Polyangiaceae bacterium]
MTKVEVFEQILRGSIRDGMQLEDILLRALVLHTHAVALHEDISLDDAQVERCERRLVLAPLTRSHVVELLSSLWPEDEERGRQDFWFTAYSHFAPYEVFEDVPGALRDKAIAARESIAGHPLVQQLLEE